MRLLIVFAGAVLLTGCATIESPVPAGYAGPVARVEDSNKIERAEKAQMFVLAAVDGRPIDTAIRSSTRASAGMGSVLRVMEMGRDVPAKPMKVHIVGTHQTGAPIAEILYRAAGQFQSVEGDVEFTPVAGKNYVVNGDLKPELSCVWIEEAVTLTVVTEKVCTKKAS